MNYGDLEGCVVCSFDPDTYTFEICKDQQVSAEQKKEESDLPPPTRIVNWRD